MQLTLWSLVESFLPDALKPASLRRPVARKPAAKVAPARPSLAPLPTIQKPVTLVTPDASPAVTSSPRSGVTTRPAPASSGGTSARADKAGRRADNALSKKSNAAARESMQAKYDRVVAEMLAAHGVRVRRWRKSMSGVAWLVTYRDGSIARLLESPKPKGPLSMAIFLHEIGHHAIGLGVYKPRCLEEYHAWAFSLREMEARGLNVTEAVRRRVKRSLQYAVDKAVRRGIRELPPELLPYVRDGAAKSRSP